MAQARRQLVLRLTAFRWPVPVTSVVVVFDARGMEPSGTADGLIRIRFAAPSADAYIQDAIRTSRAPSRLLVVSDDREILQTAQSHGAKRHPSRWLLLPPTSSSPRGREAADSRRTLPAANARRITEELARKWLKPSGS